MQAIRVEGPPRNWISDHACSPEILPFLEGSREEWFMLPRVVSCGSRLVALQNVVDKRADMACGIYFTEYIYGIQVHSHGIDRRYPSTPQSWKKGFIEMQPARNSPARNSPCFLSCSLFLRVRQSSKIEPWVACGGSMFWSVCCHGYYQRALR